MTTIEADVALLTERRYVDSAASEGDSYLENILRDDRLLQSALELRGLSSLRVDWADPNVDWSRFRCAVFRTTWDYFERIAEFTAWLERAGKQTRLCNDACIVSWNMDKHYLAELEAKSIPVVQSRYIERGSATTLSDLLEASGWDEAVIKPCISGTARHTYRVNRDNADSLNAVVQSLLAAESLILQPFQKAVMHRGEDTLMVFSGRFSHAVRKVPKDGDFRVQDDHGGTVHPCDPTPEQIGLAERAIAACPQAPVYGRVDMVRDALDRWAVMEVELIEPELWLRRYPPAATVFAEIIAGIAIS